MASSSNFATWNAVAKASRVNLTVADCLAQGNTGSDVGISSSIGVTSGKWYIEMRVNVNGNYPYVGLNADSTETAFAADAGQVLALRYSAGGGSVDDNTGSTTVDNWGTVTVTTTGVSAASDGDVIGIAIDLDNKKLWFSVNGTYFNSGNPAGGSNPQFAWTGSPLIVFPGAFMNNTSSDAHINAGQDSTFGGTETAGGNTDGSFGDFLTSPPTNFKALCSGRVPIDEDVDPKETEDDYPQKLFNSTNWSGSGASKALTGIGFQPDLVMTKLADQASQDWSIFDSTRGVQKLLETSSESAEATDANSLTAFGSDGFTVGSTTQVNMNGALGTGYCWRANGGTTASNSDGSITSTVQANTAAGFSIITYTGTGSNATIGHGLSAKPDFFMVKDRGRAESWNVYHSILGATKYLVLNTTAAEEDNVNRWNDTEPTTSTIGLGTNDNTNGSSTYVCYAWHNVEGYTKFSTYIGNGNANGPTIWLGFLPKMVWIKRYDSTGDWNVYRWDTSSVNSGYIDLPVNPIEARLELNTGNSRDTGEPIDFLATGIKIKDDDGHINTSGGKYIVCAWGNKSFTYNSIL